MGRQNGTGLYGPLKNWARSKRAWHKPNSNLKLFIVKYFTGCDSVTATALLQWFLHTKIILLQEGGDSYTITPCTLLSLGPLQRIWSSLQSIWHLLGHFIFFFPFFIIVNFGLQNAFGQTLPIFGGSIHIIFDPLHKVFFKGGQFWTFCKFAFSINITIENNIKGKKVLSILDEDNKCKYFTVNDLIYCTSTR